MEELRAAAFAYYKNATKEFHHAAWDFFQAMDANGDGKVSLCEYVEFLQQHGYDYIRSGNFSDFDIDHDGYLDFWEVMTLYYAVKTRTVGCDTCLKSLYGLYFTCIKCFHDPTADTYDICCDCYGKKSFRHPHNEFLDSYVLLRTKNQRSWPSSTASIGTNSSQSSPPSPFHVNQNQSVRPTWFEAFQAFETGFTIGTYAQTLGCSIM